MSVALHEPNILIIDADTATVDVLACYLGEDAYSVDRASDAEHGIRLANETQPDLIVLDVALPNRNGLDVFRALRATRDVPIIIVSTRNSETDRVVALELGADDFVAKPFSARELVARIAAVLRRARCVCGAVRGMRSLMSDGQLEIDRTSLQARLAGRRIPLTPTEFRILEALAKHCGQILTRAQLLDYVAFDGDVFDRTLDKHIANLRKKIEADPSRPRHVLTVFGVGYKFVA